MSKTSQLGPNLYYERCSIKGATAVRSRALCATAQQKRCSDSAGPPAFVVIPRTAADSRGTKSSGNMRLLPLACMLALFLLSGCKVGPNYHPPVASMPAAWGETEGSSISSQSTSRPSTQPAWRPAMQPGQLASWWKRFDDPVLDQLIQEAVAGSPTLRQAEARVRLARAQRQIAAAPLWPFLNSSASYERLRISKNAFGGGASASSGGTTAAPGAAGGGGSFDTNLYQAGFDASWELDVFGRTRRSVEAADANYGAAVEDRRDVLVSLLAEVGLNYMQLRGFQRQIIIAENNLQTQRQTLELTQLRLSGGIATELEVDQAAAQVAATESVIQPFRTATRQAIHLLSTLTGRDPMSLSQRLTPPSPIPDPPPEIPLGLPSDLLRQRADIRRAERQLASATAQIGVAVADLFPRFSLTGDFGWQSTNLRNWFNGDSVAWSAGPGMSWPIFQGGAIRANIRARTAIQEQAAAAYEQAVLAALRDVEDALAAYANEQVHLKLLSDAVAADKKALDMARLLFEQGRTDFLNVLDAQRSLFIAQDAQVRSTSALASDAVTLYKALGGGWEAMGPEGEKANNEYRTRNNE